MDPMTKVDRVAAPASGGRGNNRWIQSPKSVEVTWRGGGAGGREREREREREKERESSSVLLL
jgi:hypothetical protein